MQKIIIPISKCIPGMITAQPIINLKTGTTIVGQNQELSEESISNLQNFIHTDIWIYLDSSEKVWKLPEETIENYKKYSEILMSVIGTKDTITEMKVEDFKTLCKDLPVTFSSNYSLIGCTNLIEQLDYNTYNHSLNVAFIAILICKWANLSSETTSLAIQASLLHDIGKLNLSFDGYSDPSTWTVDQRLEYEKHSIYSYNVVNKIKDLDPVVAKAVLGHHERCDGTGFPLHLTSPYINTVGKILGLADTYEMLHTKHHIFDTIKILLTDQLTGFDPKLLLNFCSNVANYYIGSFVTLNTGDIGEVVFIHPHCTYRPIIKINDRFINLYDEPSITIESIQ